MIGRCSVAVLNDFSPLGEYADIRVLSFMILYLSPFLSNTLLDSLILVKVVTLLICVVLIVDYVITSCNLLPCT
jgi:hypothetical protein